LDSTGYEEIRKGINGYDFKKVYTKTIDLFSKH